ncbi:MAG: hypothetical protein JXA13_00985 [Anaerolineales bacterium]|nr:hypothetical protein [Anaerolineales bacterium]
MNKKSGSVSRILIMVVVLTWGMTACAGQTEANPQAWIDYPVGGAEIPVGSSVNVLSHVFAPGGVAEVVLSVNGDPYRRDVPPASGGDFVSVQQAWAPNEPGSYTLQVQGYDLQGQPGKPAVVSVRAVGETKIDVSPTPVITDTPTPVVTDTPTPVPDVASIEFYAYPAEIEAGACTTLYWNAVNVQRVIFGGIDQPLSGSYEDCLCSDERYSLRVIHLDGTEETRTVDIRVNGSCEEQAPPSEEPPPAADTQAPPVPSPIDPPNGTNLACVGTQTLTWTAVKDKSGIAAYYVKLEMEIKRGQWQSAGGQQVSNTQAAFSVSCGGRYRWMVRAQDGAGNYSDWSAPSYFGLIIG